MTPGFDTIQKTTKWGTKSKGVEDRIARQNGVNSVHSSVRLGKVDKPTMETSREGLERKAKIYEQLRKGKSGGLSEKQLEVALIDVGSEFSPRMVRDDREVWS